MRERRGERVELSQELCMLRLTERQNVKVYSNRNKIPQGLLCGTNSSTHLATQSAVICNQHLTGLYFTQIAKNNNKTNKENHTHKNKTENVSDPSESQFFSL